MTYVSTTAWVVILATVLGCQSKEMNSAKNEQPMDPSATANASRALHVEVFYRERMMLPPTATLEVVLEDGAKMDVAAELVAKESMTLKGAPPYRVTLHYDRAKLHGRGRYGVRARIENEGKLMFISTQFNPAFGTHGSIDAPPNDPVKILVSRVAGRRTAATSITGTRWVLKKLRGEDAGTGADGKAPFLTLQGAEPRVSGFAGCNQFTGIYQIAGQALSFSKVAMTARACPEGMDLDREVAKVLAETKSYEISDDVLRLRNEAGGVVAELQAE